jgi:hypothetical protein
MARLRETAMTSRIKQKKKNPDFDEPVACQFDLDAVLLFYRPVTS